MRLGINFKNPILKCQQNTIESLIVNNIFILSWAQWACAVINVFIYSTVGHVYSYTTGGFIYYSCMCRRVFYFNAITQ